MSPITLLFVSLFTFGFASAKTDCDQLLANGKDMILDTPSIHAYVKMLCPRSIQIEGRHTEAAKWHNFLTMLDNGSSWTKESFAFDESFALNHIKLYQFAIENNLSLKAGLMGKPLIESWEILGKQAKQKQNRPQKKEYIRFLIRNYPCSDASVTEEIAFQLSEELVENPKLVFEAIEAEQESLNKSSPKTSCGQQAKADSLQDTAYYSNMILNGISEMIWTERARIPVKLVDQFAQLSKELGNSPALLPFQQFYEAYRSGLELELVPHTSGKRPKK